VERILELEDGSIEWHMGTSSTPGGSIVGSTLVSVPVTHEPNLADLFCRKIPGWPDCRGMQVRLSIEDAADSRRMSRTS
jgi:hypothetical protein